MYVPQTTALLSSAVLLLALVGLSYTTTTQEYCDVCADHTMCLYHNVGDACKQGDWVTGVPASEHQLIVDLHNEFRNKVALGQETQGNPGPQPPAADMLRVAWDNDLAEVAQRWADQCIWEHDDCRDDPRFPVGQNLYAWAGKPCNNVTNEQSWTSAIGSWYSEVAGMSKDAVNDFRGASGHYTQIVWAETYLVGCGIVSYVSGDWCRKHYACNYAIAGNWLGAHIYTAGEARTKCPNATAADPRYPGLC